MTDFNQAFQRVIIQMEGKYSNDKNDSGGNQSGDLPGKTILIGQDGP